MPSDHSRSLQPDTGLEYAQRRIDDQDLIVKKLRAEGSDTRSAERLLAIYREFLAVLTPRGR